MNRFRIFGFVQEAESGRGMEGLEVEIRDADFFVDDLLAVTATDAQGAYRVDLPSAQQRVFHEKPDIYLVVKLENGRVLATTRNDLQKDVERDTEINVSISKSARIAAGLEKDAPRASASERESRLKAWTFYPGTDMPESLLREIQEDLKEASSILGLFKKYMDELAGNPDNDALPFQKLVQIFRQSILPIDITGHVHGVWMCFKTGDQEGPLSAVGNFLQMLAGTALDAQCPWVGKTFAELPPDRIVSMTDGTISPDSKAFLVINHFRRMEGRIPNNVVFEFFVFWSGLADAAADEREKYGHDKNGAMMIAHWGPSVRPETVRDVLSLSYRWQALGNKPPLSWLVDEVVQSAQGLYLGRILMATRKLAEPFNSSRPSADYAYQPAGWFVIFSEDWNAEAKRLFPFLKIPM